MRAEEGLSANSDTQAPTSKIGRYSGRLEAPPRDSQLRRPDQDHHQDTHTPQRIASGDSTLRRSCPVRPQVTSMRRRRSVTTRTDFQQRNYATSRTFLTTRRAPATMMIPRCSRCLRCSKTFRKTERKTGKNAAKSAAFQVKKNALFTDARKNAETAVRDGVAHIEQYKTKIAELRELEISQDQYLKDFALFASQEEALGAVLELFPAMFEDLSPRRAESINGTSAMLEAHSAERLQSRRRLIKHAKARIDEEHENQRIATDASALIKHYKALLLS